MQNSFYSRNKSNTKMVIRQKNEEKMKKKNGASCIGYRS